MGLGPRIPAAIWLLGCAGFAICGQAPGADFDSQHRAGELLIRQGKLAEAIPFLERARAADSAHYANGWDLALCYVQTKKFEAARQQLRAMIARKEKAELHNLLAEAEDGAGNADEAARQYQRAVDLEPGEKNLADLAAYLMRYRAYDAALLVYRQATEKFPQSAQLRVGLGVALYSRGNYDDAVESLCQAVDLDPADQRPMFFLGKMHDVSPKLAGEVTRRFAGFVEQYPRNALANYYYGLSLWKQSESVSAAAQSALVERHLKAALAADPRMADAHLQLGILYEQQQRDTEAIVALKAALRLRPDSSAAHYRLGRAYQRAGEKALAAEEMAAYKRLREKSAAEPAAR